MSESNSSSPGLSRDGGAPTCTCWIRRDGDWAADRHTCALHSDAALAAQANRVAKSRDGGGPQGWQPIETAPKDADVLLLYLDGSGVQPGYWEDDRWIACETHWLTGGGWHAEPTHWMPLPDPPAAAVPGAPHDYEGERCTDCGEPLDYAKNQQPWGTYADGKRHHGCRSAVPGAGGRAPQLEGLDLEPIKAAMRGDDPTLYSTIAQDYVDVLIAEVERLRELLASGAGPQTPAPHLEHVKDEETKELSRVDRP